MIIGLLFSVVLSITAPDTTSFLPIENGVINIWSFDAVDDTNKCGDCLALINSGGDISACFTDFGAKGIKQSGSYSTEKNWSKYEDDFPVPESVYEANKDNEAPDNEYCVYGSVNELTSGGLKFLYYKAKFQIGSTFSVECDLSQKIMDGEEQVSTTFAESKCVGYKLIQFKAEATETCSVRYDYDLGYACDDEDRDSLWDVYTVPIGKCMTQMDWETYGDSPKWGFKSFKMDGDKDQGLIQYEYSEVADCSGHGHQEACATPNNECQANEVEVLDDYWRKTVATIDDPTGCVATTSALTGDATCNVASAAHVSLVFAMISAFLLFA